MKIALLNTRNLQNALQNLIQNHAEIQIAVAWGYNGKLADILLENSAKFSSVIFGLNGFATSPDLVDRLIGIKNAFIAKADEGTFHPKIYLFQTGTNVEAIVGSANFTNGGLGRNYEACIHIKGSVGDKIFEQIRDEISSYVSIRQPATPELSDTYRRQFDAASKRQTQKNPILPDDNKNGRGLTSALSKTSWSEFVECASNSIHHDFDERISLLRKFQSLFASTENSSELSVSSWKGIAGTLRTDDDARGMDDYNWGWFGSMGGNGDFASLVAKRDPKLGEALDCIPRKDPVTLADFHSYCRKFNDAFMDAKAQHVGGYPTATRLLAMKRPDTFVCVNGKNIRNLAQALNFARTTLSLDNYWERVIVPIQASPWYNSDRPEGKNRELWDYRAAMLDIIYYDESA